MTSICKITFSTSLQMKFQVVGSEHFVRAEDLSDDPYYTRLPFCSLLFQIALFVPIVPDCLFVFCCHTLSFRLLLPRVNIFRSCPRLVSIVQDCPFVFCVRDCRFSCCLRLSFFLSEMALLFPVVLDCQPELLQEALPAVVILSFIWLPYLTSMYLLLGMAIYRRRRPRVR